MVIRRSTEKITGTVAHEQGCLRPGDPDDLPGLRLGEVAGPDDAVDLAAFFLVAISVLSFLM